MKRILPLFLTCLAPAGAESGSYVNFVRQHQQQAGVVWDMPVASVGEAPAALTIEQGGALFQLWTIEQSDAVDYLLDQKLVGAYLPTADITVTTLDPEGRVPRTRVDQPFKVEVSVTGLLNGADFPLAASNVLLERHLAPYIDGKTNPDPTDVRSEAPFSSAYLSDNGTTVLRFPASSLTAEDPTAAAGEEHFVIHALSDGTLTQTQLASGMVQVWPVASGEIKGISDGDVLRFKAPKVELLLNDLYPRSDTHLMLFEGSQVNGVEGVIVKAFPMDRETSESHVITVTELDAHLTKEGTYTIALLSETVYGRELLAEPVTFSVNRTLRVNAMQVNFTNEETAP